MFGRDLIEQVRADSREDHRMVPVIVEKCIDAVENIGVYLLVHRLPSPHAHVSLQHSTTRASIVRLAAQASRR